MTFASKTFRDAFKTKARDTCEGDFSIQSMSDIVQVVSGPHAEPPKGSTQNPWLQWDSTGSCGLRTGNHWKTAGFQPLWVDCTWGFFNFWAQIKPFDLWTWDFGQKYSSFHLNLLRSWLEWIVASQKSEFTTWPCEVAALLQRLSGEVVSCWLLVPTRRGERWMYDDVCEKSLL